MREEGDSIVPGKKCFIVYLKEHKGGVYLYIQLVEGTTLRSYDYNGFSYVDKNLFFIKNLTKIVSIIKTNSRKQFTIDTAPPDFDGVIYWEYFILNDEIHRLKFQSSW